MTSLSALRLYFSLVELCSLKFIHNKSWVMREQPCGRYIGRWKYTDIILIRFLQTTYNNIHILYFISFIPRTSFFLLYWIFVILCKINKNSRSQFCYNCGKKVNCKSSILTYELIKIFIFKQCEFWQKRSILSCMSVQ